MRRPSERRGSPLVRAPYVSPRAIADGICVHQLGGGLGNQLFEYAAGLAQARRLDCPLYIDVSAFNTYAVRPFELDRFDLAGTLVDLDFPREREDGTSGVLHRLSASLPPLSRVRLARATVFTPAGAAYDPRVLDVVPGTTLSGYFQSPRYFADVADELGELIAPVLATARQAGPSLPARYVVVHVRRGDYLAAENLAALGLAGPEYFETALDLLRQNGFGSERQVVFTDSPDLLRREFTLADDTIIYDPDLRENTLTTLGAMSAGAAMVLSNSSFSWWAAWLMTRRDPDAEVVAPIPWYATHDVADDLLPRNWLTVDRCR